MPVTNLWIYFFSAFRCNLNVFTDYANNYSPSNNELLVNNATTFSKYSQHFRQPTNIFHFNAYYSKPEDQYLQTFLCPESLTALHQTKRYWWSVKVVKIAKPFEAVCRCQSFKMDFAESDERGFRIDFGKYV